jgi:hypothetical protein
MSFREAVYTGKERVGSRYCPKHDGTRVSHSSSVCEEFSDGHGSALLFVQSNGAVGMKALGKSSTFSILLRRELKD